MNADLITALTYKTDLATKACSKIYMTKFLIMFKNNVLPQE